MTLELKSFAGEALAAVLPDLARLRISVFREWPYLYDGSPDYEERYLARYAKTQGAVLIGAFDGGRLVGAATGEPLGQELDAFQTPLKACGLDIGNVFYLAESVLDPAWRGQGIGHRFFDLRETHARDLGYGEAVFCAVDRRADDPRKPLSYRSLEPFWHKRGYQRLENVVVRFPWKDIGESEETEKPMQVWHRTL